MRHKLKEYRIYEMTFRNGHSIIVSSIIPLISTQRANVEFKGIEQATDRRIALNKFKKKGGAGV